MFGASGSAGLDVTANRGGLTAATVKVRESPEVCVDPAAAGAFRVALTLITNVSAPRSPAGTAVGNDQASPWVTSVEAVLPFGKVTVTLAGKYPFSISASLTVP